MSTLSVASFPRMPKLRLSRRVATAVVVASLATAGCSKHEWLTRQRDGTGTRPVAATDSPSRGTAPPAGTAAAGGSRAGTEAAPATPPQASPVESGGFAIPAPGEAVSELPWESRASSPPETARSECAAGECYWIQVAALADSSGAAAALARAQVSTRSAAGAPLPGGSIGKEGGLWKVRLGPWGRWEDADAALSAVRAGGFAGAWLVRHARFSG